MEPTLDLHACSYTADAFEVIGKRWTGLLIDLLLQRPARFNELSRAVPQLSRRMLTERLTELVDLGLVERLVEPGPPIAVTYRLTDRGRALQPAMDALRAWAGAPVDENGTLIPYDAHQD